MANNMGYFTTGEAAREAAVTTQTIRTWIDSGLISSAVNEVGHRRVTDAAMRSIKAANAFIDTHLESSVSRGELVGAVLRLLSIPAPRRLGATGFVQGFLVARFGPEITLRIKTPAGTEVAL